MQTKVAVWTMVAAGSRATILQKHSGGVPRAISDRNFSDKPLFPLRACLEIRPVRAPGRQGAALADHRLPDAQPRLSGLGWCRGGRMLDDLED